MHATMLRALGGSVAVTIPGALAKELRLKAGDRMEFTAEGDRLILARARRRRYTAEELVAMQGAEPLALDADWDAAPAVGAEVTP